MPVSHGRGLKVGRLDLSDDAFREAAKAYPIISPLRELRSSLSEMRPLI